MKQIKSYRIVNMQVWPDAFRLTGKRVVIEPWERGAIIAKVDPTWCRIHPDLAAKELNDAVTAYDLQARTITQ